jgi:hypothetical protein
MNWRHRPRTVFLAAGALAVAPLGLSGQQPQQQPCSAPEHRQFDFWVGTWEVTTPNGQKAGTNTIQMAMNGCAIYDASRGVWHQSWVDTTGLLLLLEGGFADGAMVLEGETTGPDGTVTRQRITWSIVDGDPNKVRQIWESQPDGGEWTVAFDGLYERTSG